VFPPRQCTGPSTPENAAEPHHRPRHPQARQRRSADPGFRATLARSRGNRPPRYPERRLHPLLRRHRFRRRPQNALPEESGSNTHRHPIKAFHRRPRRLFIERRLIAEQSAKQFASQTAAVSCQPHQRKQLERLCRYVTRPAICLERLTTNIDGKVSYELKHPFRDGTTHILFTPSDFLARLAALVPRPRANLTRYHGVFAPNSPFRQFIVPGSPKRARRKCKTSTDSKPYESNPDSEQSNGDPEPLTAPLSWAQRLKRVFEIDILLCPRCGGTLRVIADVTDPDVIRTILEHLKQRAPPQRASPARSQDDLFAAS